MNTIIKVGDIVNYVMAEGTNYGEIRPAIVVRVWSDACVQLQVFTDKDNDFGYGHGPDLDQPAPCVLWKTSVVFDPSKSAGTWHR